MATIRSPHRGLWQNSHWSAWIVVAIAAIGPLTAAGQQPAPAPMPGQAVMQAYEVGPQAAQRARELTEKYRATANVRIAADAKAGRLVVLAPAEVQREIAASLAKAPAVRDEETARREAPSATPAEVPANRAPSAPLVNYSYRLEHLQGSQFQRLLERLPGITAATNAQDGKRTQYSIMQGGAPAGAILLNAETGEVTLSVPAAQMAGWKKLLELYDRRTLPLGQKAELVSVKSASRAQLEQAVSNLNAATGEKDGTGTPRLRWGGDLVDGIFQQKMLAQAEPAPGAQAPPAAAPPAAAPGGALPGPGAEAPPAAGDDDTSLIGPVQLEYIEGLDVIVVRGNKRDVDRVIKIIEDIEKMSATTQVSITVHGLKNVDAQQLTDLVRQFYDQVLSPRTGRVSYFPLSKPNAVLIIGRTEGVKALEDVLAKLDQPVAPNSQFTVLPLRYMAAVDAEASLRSFYENRGGLGVKARILADYRTNSLLVYASPRDLAEIREVVKGLDVVRSEAANEVKVFRLRNSLADELAPILQDAISGQSGGGTSRTQGGGGAAQQFLQGATGGNQQGTGNNAASRAGVSSRSAMLQFAVIDPEQGKLLKSGILTDVRIASDPRSNTLVVTGPPESMDLIGALIEQLDSLPGASSVLKVFTIVNGDASALATMLQQLFGLPVTTGQGGGGGGAAAALLGLTATGQGDSSLVSLRFAVDQRTNSIITSGSPGDLSVVEAILLRLDASDVRQRKTEVYRLRNAPANDVATAINQFLTSERQVQQLAPGTYSPFEQIEREVVVVPEQVSNSLIVSATPRYFDEIKRIVDELDKRPPMVLIQVLIGEVELTDRDEFGVELGLQDSLLFNRSVLNTTAVPGFNFNNTLPLGNAASAASLATKDNVAGQAISNFSLGRSNTELGYGGLVLSASSDSVSVLMRALQDKRHIQVLSRPQVMTLDNQPAFVQVGSRVPRITSSQQTTTGTVNNTVLENVGIILGVTPRISPDGQVVMEIDAERSELGTEAEGIPISINQNGDVIRSPQIKTTTAQTTVSARSGQTVVLGGLISKNTLQNKRRVPWLSDIPLVGDMFRYDNSFEQRKELLIIMTPIIVKNDEDVEHIKHVESSRMSWCLADVIDMHGDVGLNSRCEPAGDWGPMTIYPDETPAAQEQIPGPAIRQPGGALPMGNPPNPLPVPAGKPAPMPAPPPEISPTQMQHARWQPPANGGWNGVPAGSYPAPAPFVPAAVAPNQVAPVSYQAPVPGVPAPQGAPYPQAMPAYPQTAPPGPWNQGGQ